MDDVKRWGFGVEPDAVTNKECLVLGEDLVGVGEPASDEVVEAFE